MPEDKKTISIPLSGNQNKQTNITSLDLKEPWGEQKPIVTEPMNVSSSIPLKPGFKFLCGEGVFLRMQEEQKRIQEQVQQQTIKIKAEATHDELIAAIKEGNRRIEVSNEQREQAGKQNEILINLTNRLYKVTILCFLAAILTIVVGIIIAMLQ